MSKRLGEEYKGESLTKQANPKVTGAVFLLLALIVFLLGLMVHYVQTGGLSNDQIIDVLVAQLHIKFATDFFVGFFTGIFAVIGIQYLKQKGESQDEASE
jgi:hypothetical protein